MADKTEQWIEEYFRRLYGQSMDPLRRQATLMKAQLPSSYMGRGMMASSGWERRAGNIDTELLRAGTGLSQSLGTEKARIMTDLSEKRRGEEQARKQGWGRLIGTGLGMAASFIPGMQPFAPALMAGGSQLGGMATGGAGSEETMAMMQDPEFLEYLQYLRKLYGVTPEKTGGQGFFGKYGQQPR